VDTGAARADAYVPRALLARLVRPIEVLTETVECTMVFADVSGFPRLSELLARRGKEGAEQLVDIINNCFSALLGRRGFRSDLDQPGYGWPGEPQLRGRRGGPWGTACPVACAD
jgi:class 3 adenylate cyclase